ncbi:hypothetical protein HDK77DRAFT_447603 [Phyllosticta capitalensis]
MEADRVVKQPEVSVGSRAEAKWCQLLCILLLSPLSRAQHHPSCIRMMRHTAIITPYPKNPSLLPSSHLLAHFIGQQSRRYVRPSAYPDNCSLARSLAFFGTRIVRVPIGSARTEREGESEGVREQSKPSRRLDGEPSFGRLLQPGRRTERRHSFESCRKRRRTVCWLPLLVAFLLGGCWVLMRLDGLAEEGRGGFV